MLLVDLDQDAGVAAAHDQQGDDVERDKVEHIVERFLPAVPEAAVSCTLREVHAMCSHRPKDKELEHKDRDRK